METRANYVLIGACTLAGIVLGLAFFVWLAKIQIDRQYAYYYVLFENVSGLSRAADVRFSGLSVGQVVSLDLDDGGSGLVRVRIEVEADTPIHEGATAQLQAQGVTGVSLVSLSAGDASKPLLRDSAGGAVPVIQGERSVVQSLTEDAPDLLAESIKLVKEFQNIVGTENQARLTAILANVETASGAFETALTDFSSISRSVAEATGQISVFTDKLQPIANSIESALGEAEKTMTAMTGAFNQAGTTLGTADVALKTVDGAAAAAGDLIRDDGAATIAALKATVTDPAGARRVARDRGEDRARGLRRHRDARERPADRPRDHGRQPRQGDHRGDDDPRLGRLGRDQLRHAGRRRRHQARRRGA